MNLMNQNDFSLNLNLIQYIVLALIEYFFLSGTCMKGCGHMRNLLPFLVVVLERKRYCSYDHFRKSDVYQSVYFIYFVQEEIYCCH